MSLTHESRDGENKGRNQHGGSSLFRNKQLRLSETSCTEISPEKKNLRGVFERVNLILSAFKVSRAGPQPSPAFQMCSPSFIPGRYSRRNMSFTDGVERQKDEKIKTVFDRNMSRASRWNRTFCVQHLSKKKKTDLFVWRFRKTPKPSFYFMKFIRNFLFCFGKTQCKQFLKSCSDMMTIMEEFFPVEEMFNISHQQYWLVSKETVKWAPILTN